MHRRIFLIVILSISLVGVSFVSTGFAENVHSFDSKFGTSGIFTPGSFLSPQHLAFDSEDNLYVTDLGNARVQKFDSSGNFLFEWGSRGTESGKFGHPSGIAISNEFVFVVDNRNNNVQKFDLSGNFITEWGEFGINNGSFKSPRGITISDDQSVFVVDSGNARIQKFTFDGEYITHFGQSGKRGGELITPVDIAINSDKIFVTDSVQNRINIFDLNGNFLRAIDNTVGGLPIYPEGIIFDEQNNFYISDYRNNRIIQYNESGNYLSIFGQMGTGDGQFKFPKDLAISEDGYLFVTDTQGHRIQKFSTPVSLQYSSMIKEELGTVIQQVEPETQSLTITPNDFKKPTILVPSDVLVEASGLLTSVNIGDALATDENGILSLSHNAPSSFPLGINTIIWTAIDGAGNMAIASQIVTIQDTIPPKISPLDEISLEAKSSNQNTVFLDVPLVTDDVGVYSITNDAPEVFPLGETIVTWTADDVIGNTSTLTQSVYLIDSISPRIAIPDDIAIEASNLNENLVELITPESFDQVAISSITNDAPEVFPLGETIVTWTATDTSGNSAFTTQIISVLDTTVPV
ncbi:MAG: 6-bladed beta-propeller, partial [Candidatus Nitrosopelagicus sp.]|nr:6-bladed beta-propeller [Candidatus Nitrosopelagicus sp.]